MVERPKRVEPRGVRFFALLPVYPPKVNAVVLHGLMQNIEIGFCKFLIRNVEEIMLSLLRVVTHKAGKFLVFILEPTHSRRRVKIKRHLEIFAVKPIKEALGVGEKVGIPAVARPAYGCR